MTAPFRLYGAELSPYSLKVRSYLRFKGLDFEWLTRSNARQEEFTRYAKQPLMPVLVDAADTALQDSTPIIEALERVGMAHRAKHLPGQLSGGQQQRVAVARALAGKPAILLADEPTGNLDSRNGEAVMDLLKELHAGGATICMVTHDERFAGHAERAVHLLDGRVVEDRLAA